MSVIVRPFSRDDLSRLACSLPPEELAHYQERLEWSTDGVACYLVAWSEGEPVGRATLLWQSKYPRVRQQVGCCEVNALEATPRRTGTGAALMAAAEDAAHTRGRAALGVAVDLWNVEARKFYDRLEYRDWERGTVVDEWDEYDQDGALVRHHADPCDYLVKSI